MSAINQMINKEKTMDDPKQDRMNLDKPKNDGRRGFFSRVIAIGGTGLALPGVVQAAQSYWEEGDPKCSAPESSTTPAYPLTAELLDDFIRLSEAITGFEKLDRYLASDYLRRFASNAKVAATLPALISAHKKLTASGAAINDEALKETFIDDAALQPATYQLVYLWYLSAFGIPDAKNQITWFYDEVEQYEKGLLWKAAHAHAPMAHGGPYGHWQQKPRGV